MRIIPKYIIQPQAGGPQYQVWRPKVGEKGVALKVGDKTASQFTPLHAPGINHFHSSMARAWRNIKKTLESSKNVRDLHYKKKIKKNLRCLPKIIKYWCQGIIV